jgi:hypothetical protein
MMGTTSGGTTAAAATTMAMDAAGIQVAYSIHHSMETHSLKKQLHWKSQMAYGQLTEKGKNNLLLLVKYFFLEVSSGP